MAANVETLFVTRKPAWHGQGIILDAPPTAEDAIVAAGLDWKVEGRPIFDESGNQIPGFQANTRDKDDKILGVVSDRYQIIQNEEAFAFVDGLVEEGLTFETAGSLRGGKQIWVLGNMPERLVLGEQFAPYICFTNTHDGTGAVRVCLTPTRVVCQNTLNLALSHADRSWSTRHMGTIASRMTEAQAALGMIDSYYESLNEEAERLASIKVSDKQIEDMLDMMYQVKDDDSEGRKRRIALLKENFFMCLNAADLANFKGTAYAVVNAAADFADHAEPLRRTANFDENRWSQIIVGHPFVDQIHKRVLAA